MKDGGGPAYPVTGWQGNSSDNPGMSLLDYFVGQALAGEMATWVERLPEEQAEKIACRCYAIATAMIAEKRKRES
jgi:hypothetical protein